MPRRPRASKASRAQGASFAPTPVHSTHTTPCSSAFPSAYPSEDEYEPEDGVKLIPMHNLSMKDFSPEKKIRVHAAEVAPKPFRFLDLPSELRLKIYGYHFADTDSVIDLHHENYKHVHKKLAILKTCRMIYAETSHFFYSTRTFRVFSTHPGRFLKTKKQLLARLKPHQRACISKLELRLGPSWSKPPRGWVVNNALGLKDCVNVHKLSVFVQIDPSLSFFNGYRQADGFYEEFSGNLLSGMLAEMPHLPLVEFDAEPCVSKCCLIMQKLLTATVDSRKRISWGPQRGWTDTDELEEIKTIPASALLDGMNTGILAVA